MAQHPPHKVWVHFDEQGRNPTKVSVVNCNDVDDLVKAALLKLYQSVSPDLVSVTFGGEKVKTDAAVTDYVTMTSDDKPLLLHISHKKRKVDVGTLPTLGDSSPSDFARRSDSSIAKKVHDTPLYAHWFAVELYDQFHLIENANGNSAQQVQCELAGIQHTIPIQSLENVAGDFWNIRSFPESISGQIERELSLTACFARALDRFLFSDDNISKGACMHQLPIKNNKQAIHHPDLCVTGLHNDCPDHPVLLCDYKLDTLEMAEKVTSGYVIEVMSTGNSTWTTKLGLAFAGNDAKLFVFVASDGYVHKIEVCNISLQYSPSHVLRAFFAVLFGAVHTLLQKRELFVSDVPTMVPLRDIAVVELLSGSRECRLFRSADMQTVYKMYDSEHRVFSPNFYDAMKSIRSDYLPGMSLKKLDSQGRVQCLSYDFIKGTHKPQNLQHFKAIFNDLDTLHGQGFVHVDIRMQNLLFSEDNQAWMIDFDHADKEDTLYPDTYNHTGIDERHRCARACLPRRKEHDRYALSVILKNHFEGQEEVIKQLRDEHTNLSDIVL